MLVSHRKKFIFTKTSKTAGTSVESYYEPFCMPEGEWVELHNRDCYISETGIIGFRGPGRANLTPPPLYWNHMNASKLKEKIGEDTWNNYFKFTTIRNPFDKIISKYFFNRFSGKRWRNRPLLYLFEKKLKQINPPKNLVIADFRKWMSHNMKLNSFVDRDKYIIHGKECVDFFIRYENLHDDIQTVNKILQITDYNRQLPTWKSEFRKTTIPIHEFYNAELEKKVREIYAWEFERFGYDMPL